MTYDLRRLRLHGLIARIPHTQRYRVTREGLRTALFFTRVYARILRPGLARIVPSAACRTPRYAPAFDQAGGCHRPLDRSGQTRRMKLDSFAPYVPLLGV